MTPDQIQRIRHQLGLSTREFGARLYVSHRTVESWEQGLRSPSALTVREMLRLSEDRTLTRHTTSS
ncbi:MAG: helix-turn-helix domain-containing protein [Acidobacteria bacterium]|nr:helix-turn-helix domain-containing protein [Acidobacteriota bacterium]